MSKNWMSTIPDNTKLGDICIPGTHDSTTWRMGRGKGTEWHRTQNKTISEQLDLGVRFFDIRYGRDGKCYHGDTECRVSLKDVFNSFINFLKSETSKKEFLIVRMKKETDKDTNEEEFTKPLSDFRDSGFVWKRIDDKTLPLLKDVRAKIIILEQYDENFYNKGYGFKWGDGNVMTIQDDYKQCNPGKKRNRVVSHFGTVRPDILSINFVSAAGASSFRTTPSHHDSAIAPKVMAHLLRTNRKTGILVWDYVDLNKDVDNKDEGKKVKAKNVSKIEIVIRNNRNL